MMMEQQENAILSELVVEIGRSLLQYVDECFPREQLTAAKAFRETVSQAAAQQREHVGDLVQLLVSRGEFVDFGVYPKEFTSLHYVSLEYLRSQLVTGQKAILKLLDGVVAKLKTGETASELVAAIRDEQRQHLEALSRLGEGVTTSAPPAAMTNH